MVTLLFCESEDLAESDLNVVAEIDSEGQEAFPLRRPSGNTSLQMAGLGPRPNFL